MAPADAVFEHFVRETARGFLRVGRRRFDVGRRMARHIDQLDVEHEHPFRLTLSAVRESFGNPQPALLAGHHQLQAFAETGDDAADAESGRLAFADRAVEHRAVGLPSRIVHDDDVVFRRVIFAGSFRQHF